MKKFAILILVAVLFCSFFLALAVQGQVVNEPATLPSGNRSTDYLLPIVTSVAIVSESMPIVNKKVHGILHLLVAIFKLFRRK